MFDQVGHLLSHNIQADVVCSAKTRVQNQQVSFYGYFYSLDIFIMSFLQTITVLTQKNTPLRVLYVTPEMIATDRFQRILSSLYANKSIGLFAVDEAHIISQWGHQFRPEYRKLGILRESWPDVPIVALTATAVPEYVDYYLFLLYSSPRIRDDIKEQLKMNNPASFITSFNRPNMFESSSNPCNSSLLC